MITQVKKVNIIGYSAFYIINIYAIFTVDHSIAILLNNLMFIISLTCALDIYHHRGTKDSEIYRLFRNHDLIHIHIFFDHSVMFVLVCDGVGQALFLNELLAIL
ncbi:hypothetical protein; putative membrane protein [Xenorhabdus bovienii str. Jollieti]|uniref:Uncharacterized protein n=1 Tax=Xenorhabdus bovienii (strain SS-2004) TaxID=406818 RepID=D3UYS0_XENBS|nr:hypothetical protein; putative membrane protein [Xenorhabdus bovienii SS-2004]CDH27000.1 hypothetical protein; putative membrane protein [Xenorhabdus bovienii str. Jollieti]